MAIEVGHVEAIFRYPVKSMAGERLEVAEVGWHGLEGDRRLALRRVGYLGGMPWLTAGKLADLVRFVPFGGEDGELPTHVRTPEGSELAVYGEELAAEVGGRFGAPVEMMRLDQGIFDVTSMSVMSCSTVAEVGRLAGVGEEVRRFRPNLLVRLANPTSFGEDAWVGGVLAFGDGVDAPAMAVTMRDVRCAMVNLDPDTAASTPEVLRSVVRANGKTAGVYGTVLRVGRLEVGQTIYLHVG